MQQQQQQQYGLVAQSSFMDMSQTQMKQEQQYYGQSARNPNVNMSPTEWQNVPQSSPIQQQQNAAMSYKMQASPGSPMMQRKQNQQTQVTQGSRFTNSPMEQQLQHGYPVQGSQGNRTPRKNPAPMQQQHQQQYAHVKQESSVDLTESSQIEQEKYDVEQQQYGQFARSAQMMAQAQQRKQMATQQHMSMGAALEEDVEQQQYAHTSYESPRMNPSPMQNQQRYGHVEQSSFVDPTESSLIKQQQYEQVAHASQGEQQLRQYGQLGRGQQIIAQQRKQIAMQQQMTMEAAHQEDEELPSKQKLQYDEEDDYEPGVEQWEADQE